MDDFKHQVLEDVYDRIKILTLAKVEDLYIYQEGKYIIAKVFVKLRCSELISYYCYERIDHNYKLISYTLNKKEAEKAIPK